jgi:alpha-methylacyl-CoA racemase
MLFFFAGLGLNMDDINKETIEKAFKTKTREEWEEIFKNLDACVTPVLELDEVTTNQHNLQRKSFITLKDGNIIPRMNWLNELGIKTDNYELPVLGQHTTEVLSEFGYSSENIKKLLDEGTVVQSDIKSKL